MNTNKTILTLVGFVLAGTGFLALSLTLVGVKLSFLTWLDRPGPLFGFIGKLLLVLVGMVMVYMGRTDWQREEI